MLCEIYLKKSVGFFYCRFLYDGRVETFFPYMLAIFVYYIVNGLSMFFVLVVLFLFLLKIHSESTWTSVFFFLSTLFSAGKYCRWHASSQKRRPVLKPLTVQQVELILSAAE